MFYPVHDDNPLKSIGFQWVTIGLIVVNTLIYFFQEAYGLEASTNIFGFLPAELTRGAVPDPAVPIQAPTVPTFFKLFSHMFLHGNIWHLAGNMLFLWVFGDNVEDAFGHVKFLLFYLVCGIAGGLMHAFITQAPNLRLIGASGAVAGIIAAYLILHPRVRVWVLFLRIIPLRISAALLLGIWVLNQVVMVLIPTMDNVAWWAHIGGLIAGAILVFVLRRPGVELFDRGLPPVPAKVTP
ncbi:MAG: rhomboid family intramembrane serine protease [Hyphomicrobiaceae bacterium]